MYPIIIDLPEEDCETSCNVSTCVVHACSCINMITTSNIIECVFSYVGREPGSII